MTDDLHELRLDGQTALVTGAARGIGYAVCELLARRGADVWLADLDADAAKAAATSVGGHSVTLDVTRPDDCAAAVAAARSSGRLDILVNCAGIAGGNRYLWEMTDEQWGTVMDVNLNGTFHMCRAAVPTMREQGYGRIVNVASMAGKDGNPRASHYSAAKAGVIALTKSLGKELARDGVLTAVIAPAVIDTDMAKGVTPEQLQYMRDLIPMGRFGQPLEVARLVGFLVSGHLSFSTGAVYDISGGRATY